MRTRKYNLLTNNIFAISNNSDFTVFADCFESIAATGAFRIFMRLNQLRAIRREKYSPLSRSVLFFQKRNRKEKKNPITISDGWDSKTIVDGFRRKYQSRKVLATTRVPILKISWSLKNDRILYLFKMCPLGTR